MRKSLCHIIACLCVLLPAHASAQFAGSDKYPEEILNNASRDFIIRKTVYSDQIPVTGRASLPRLNSEPVNLIDKFDSSSRRQFEEDQRNKINSALEPFLHFNPSIHGSLRIESYAGNLQNPLIMSEKAYMRVYARPTFTCFNLPFTANLYYTTEDNSIYNSNRFSIQFDARQYRQNIEEQIHRQNWESDQQARKRLSQIRSLEGQEKILQQEIDHLKNIDPQLEEHKAQLLGEGKKRQSELEKAAADEMNARQKQLNDTLTNFTDTSKLQSAPQFPGRNTELPFDTQLLKRVMMLENKLAEMKRQRAQLEYLLKADSLFNRKDEVFAAQRAKTSGIKQEADNPRGLKMLTCIDHFNVGAVNPYLSQYTVNGLTGRGVDLGMSFSRIFFDVSAGRMQRNSGNFLEDKKPDFKQKLLSSKVGIGKRDGAHVALNTAWIEDADENSFAGRDPQKNFLYSIEGSLSLSKKINLSGELAQSYFWEDRQSTRINVVGETVTRPRFPFGSNTALKLNSAYRLGKTTDIDLQFSRVDGAYRSLGNPQLQKDMQESQFKLKQSLFKEQLNLSLSYKKNRDNLERQKAATTRMEGWGFKLATSLKNKKLPNLILSYSPYQQGNNHPDSLLRTNNTYSVTSAILTWNRRIKQFTLGSVINMVRCKMDYHGLGIVGMNNFSFTQLIQHGGSMLMLNSQRIFMSPGTDTSNSVKRSLTLSHNFNAALKLSLSADMLEYNNAAYMRGGGLGVNWMLSKRISLNSMFTYHRIHKMWGREEAHVLRGRLAVDYRL